MSESLQHAELSIIGSILLTEGSALDEIDFDPESYQDQRCETIHRLMAGMRATGEPINVLTVQKFGASNGQRVDAKILHHAMAITPTASTVTHYARIVADAYAGRNLAATAEWIKAQASRGVDPALVIEQAKANLEDALGGVGLRKVLPIGSNIEAYVDELEKQRVYYETPWPQINDLIGGLMPGALYVVGARPSVGKTAVGLQLAQTLEPHGAVAFVGLEMLEADLMDRLVANEMKIPLQRITAGNLTSEDWQRMAGWLQTVEKHRIYVSEPHMSTLPGIQKFISDVGRADKLAGVVIDYLQLIKQAGERMTEQEFLSEVTRELKLMALQLNIPIVLLSQLNRGSANREDKMPRSSDLRGSGSIEQDADVIILLHRELKGDESYRMYMNVEKNRRGRAGDTEMVFQGHYMNVHDEMSN